MLPVKVRRRDPAPSRLRYRLTRLWLWAPFRRTTNLGMPALAVFGLVWTLADEFELRQSVATAVSTLKDSFIERPQFTVSRLSIPDVSPDLAEQIGEASFVGLPVSSLDIDVSSIRSRVEALDAVERARVRILANGVLEIRAIERVPVVVWRSPSGLQILDANGIRVAEIDDRKRRADLPLIVGVGADQAVPEALGLLAAAGPLLPRMRGLIRVGNRRWDIVLDHDRTIRLPELAPAAAVSALLRLDSEEDLTRRDFTMLDLRDPRRPAIRLSESSLEALSRHRREMAGEDA
jgi:cell division protein FtsQ